MSIADGYAKVKTENCKTKARRRKPKAKPKARRFWLDIGKNISLVLTAAKYDFDQADAGGEDAQ